MVAATAVDVAVIDDLAASNLQDVLGQIYGKAKYAADGVGEAIYKAEQAQLGVDNLGGTVQYAANGVGTLDYHVRVIAGLVGYNGYPASIA